MYQNLAELEQAFIEADLQGHFSPESLQALYDFYSTDLDSHFDPYDLIDKWSEKTLSLEKAMAYEDNDQIVLETTKPDTYLVEQH